jgi:glutamyl-tRNA synthetase
VKDVGKSAGKFDFKKLGDLNGHYIRQASIDELMGHLETALPGIPSLDDIKTLVDEKAPPRADLALMTAVKDVRPDIKTGTDLLAAFDAAGRDKLAAALPSLRERAQTLAEMATGALYLIVQRPLMLDAKASALVDADAKTALAALIERLAAANDWTAAALEAVVRDYAEVSGAKFGKLAQPLRAALTGRAVSPPVFDIMTVLGRDETLARLRDQT